MSSDQYPEPRQYPGVMVSSTFTDLEKHRAALIKAIGGQDLKAVAMENDSAKPDVDIIDSSLKMVRDAAAYIGVISHKYGQTPVCPKRNPTGLSITELEFNEALRLERPILLFIMGDDHQVRKGDVELNPVKMQKLDAFRERAKRMKSDSRVERVYASFNSIEEFTAKAIQSVADLHRFLDEMDSNHQVAMADRAGLPPSAESDPIPKPPAFYAEPPYIGSHQFIGRQAQLAVLNDWAAAADPHPVLLFDAIGGSGKSMLTWQWTTKHATHVREDWAGRFWYSFYERGAIMADFCRRALAYMTSTPVEYFRRIKTIELGEMLLHHLQNRPWLLVLDGLERVLVAYHRYDAAQVRDDEVSRAADQIGDRDPCASIRPEDDDLLRTLAAAAPSKLLITSRLVPRVLLNSANQSIPDVLHIRLAGLRPADAEALIRSCGVTGDSQAIQGFLKAHCDCHPLVTGVVAGLINDYVPDKGNFDSWAANPTAGGQLDLAKLNLVQKRNHILKTAIDALPDESSQLLGTLATLSEAVDGATLCALAFQTPSEPEQVLKPSNPVSSPTWNELSDVDKLVAQHSYNSALQRWTEYRQAYESWRQSPELLKAQAELAVIIRDLDRRGLLQYENLSRRYDLHPVVRGVAASRLRPHEENRYGQRVVDYFSQHAHGHYDMVETLEDIAAELHVVRTLLKMRRYEQAIEAYSDDLAWTLFFNLEAYAEIVSLLRPFFPTGWASSPDNVPESYRTSLATDAAGALNQLSQRKDAVAVLGNALLFDLHRSRWRNLSTSLRNISKLMEAQNRLAKAEKCALLGLNVAALNGDLGGLFAARMLRFEQLGSTGRWSDAEEMWGSIDRMGRDWPRFLYRPGDAEYAYAEFRFRMKDLREEHLATAEGLARAGKNRPVIRLLHSLRGEWHLQRGEWERATEHLHEAVRMTRAVGKIDAGMETTLALAKLRQGKLEEPQRQAEQLNSAREPAHLGLAELWLAIGDRERARECALAAYERAWADGEPYVHRHELNRSGELLKQLGATVPNLPAYDSGKEERLPWETEITGAVERLRAQRDTRIGRLR